MSELQIWREILPYAVAYIPLPIRRVLAPYLPIPLWGRMRSIVDAMDTQSTNIFNNKRNAFEKGDEAILYQVGEGRDIMSILSKYHPERDFLFKFNGGAHHMLSVKANMQASAEDQLPDEELLGQMS